MQIPFNDSPIEIELLFMIDTFSRENALRTAGIFVALSLSLTSWGCRNVSSTDVGTRRYAPLKNEQEVTVYSRESDVPDRFEVLAIIDFNDPGKYQVMSLGNAIPSIKAKARAVGATAIIVDESHPVKSGIISTGIHVSARAIRTTPGTK
jgi:hypothetical protein